VNLVSSFTSARFIELNILTMYFGFVNNLIALH
jgi:hypothetical protein